MTSTVVFKPELPQIESTVWQGYGSFQIAIFSLSLQYLHTISSFPLSCADVVYAVNGPTDDEYYPTKGFTIGLDSNRILSTWNRPVGEEVMIKQQYRSILT